MQAIIKEGGKSDIEEIKVADDGEEVKAKDYALALERMQNALKREKQIKIVKQMNEKNKMNVSDCGMIIIIINQANFNEMIFLYNRTVNVV